MCRITRAVLAAVALGVLFPAAEAQTSIGRNGETQELNSGETWDAPGNLQIRLAPEILAAYAKQGIENPALHYLRKKVEVSGTVREIRPGGKSVAAIDIGSTDDLAFILESEREAPRAWANLSRTGAWP